MKNRNLSELVCLSAAWISLRKHHLGGSRPWDYPIYSFADWRNHNNIAYSQQLQSRWSLPKMENSDIKERAWPPYKKDKIPNHLTKTTNTEVLGFWGTKMLSPGESNPALSRDRGRCYRYTREDRRDNHWAKLTRDVIGWGGKGYIPLDHGYLGNAASEFWGIFYRDWWWRGWLTWRSCRRWILRLAVLRRVLRGWGLMVMRKDIWYRNGNWIYRRRRW